MNTKFIILLVALMGEAVLSRPDSYNSFENLVSLFGSSEENSGQIGLSSDESSEEIPLAQMTYSPDKDGTPEEFLAKINAEAAKNGQGQIGQEILEQLRPVYKQYIGEPLPEPTPDLKARIDMKLNKAELNRINELRSLHGAPPLEYDEKIAAYAQNYAEKISAKMGAGVEAKFKHNTEENHVYGLGENQAGDSPREGFQDPKTGAFIWGEDTWKPSYNGQAADMWYFREIDNYKNNGNRPAAAGGPVTGHFTQVVWKKSKKMGCGMACYNKLEGATATSPAKNCNVVCNFYPAGNVQSDEQYQENVNMDMDEQRFAEMKAQIA